MACRAFCRNCLSGYGHFISLWSHILKNVILWSLEIVLSAHIIPNWLIFLLLTGLYYHCFALLQSNDNNNNDMYLLGVKLLKDKARDRRAHLERRAEQSWYLRTSKASKGGLRKKIIIITPESTWEAV